MRSTVRLAATAALAFTVIAGCSNSTSSDGGPTTQAPSTSDPGAAFNSADVMFVQMMIPHHEQAIEMSDMALDPNVGANAEVVDFARQIKSAQDAEVALMMGLLTEWGQPTMDQTMDHSSMGMDGMLSAADMERLGQLDSAAFDRAWIAAMIEHHEGALTMAQDVLADGANATVRTLANEIARTQQAEIELLSAALAQLGSS